MRAFIARLLLAVVIAFPAAAADLTWTWVNPTTNTDGSVIGTPAGGSLTTGRLEFGTCNGSSFGTKAGEIPLTAAQVTAHAATETNLLPQTRCARVYVSNSFGSESSASNTGQKVIPAPTPSAPTNLTASSPVAYEIRTSNGELVANRMGVIPLGTLCGAEFQLVDGVRYYSVQPSDADLVNWPSALANLRLWARCSATAAAF